MPSLWSCRELGNKLLCSWTCQVCERTGIYATKPTCERCGGERPDKPAWLKKRIEEHDNKRAGGGRGGGGGALGALRALRGSARRRRGRGREGQGESEEEVLLAEAARKEEQGEQFQLRMSEASWRSGRFVLVGLDPLEPLMNGAVPNLDRNVNNTSS